MLAVQANDFVLKMAKHALDLMVTSLIQPQPSIVGRKDFQPGGQGGEVFKFEVHAGRKRVCVVCFYWLLGRYPIHLGLFTHWLSHAARPLPVIGDKQQAAGVEIETPRQMQFMFVGLIEQVDDRLMRWMLGGTDHAYGFVKHKVACGFACLNELIIQLNTVKQADIEPGVTAAMAINLDSATGDELANLLTIKARQVAEDSVEAHVSLYARGLLASGSDRLCR